MGRKQVNFPTLFLRINWWTRSFVKRIPYSLFVLSKSYHFFFLRAFTFHSCNFNQFNTSTWLYCRIVLQLKDSPSILYWNSPVGPFGFYVHDCLGGLVWPSLCVWLDDSPHHLHTVEDTQNPKGSLFFASTQRILFTGQCRAYTSVQRLSPRFLHLSSEFLPSYAARLYCTPHLTPSLVQSTVAVSIPTPTRLPSLLPSPSL